MSHHKGAGFKSWNCTLHTCFCWTLFESIKKNPTHLFSQARTEFSMETKGSWRQTLPLNWRRMWPYTDLWKFLSSIIHLNSLYLKEKLWQALGVKSMLKTDSVFIFISPLNKEKRMSIHTSAVPLRPTLLKLTKISIWNNQLGSLHIHFKVLQRTQL